MDFQHWLRQAAAQLVGSESPRRDAEILLGLVTGKSRTFIMAFGETVLTQAQLAELDELLARRAVGEPIAYLTGEREFWSLPLRVSPATLIPRPDTECVVEQALTRLPAEPCRNPRFRHRHRRDCVGAGVRASGLCGRGSGQSAGSGRAGAA